MKKVCTLLCGIVLSASTATAQKLVSATSEGLVIIDAPTYQNKDTIRKENFKYAVATGTKAYVSTQTTNTLYFVDLNTNTIIDSMGISPIRMVALPDTNILFAAVGSVLYKINTATKTMVDSITLAAQIQYMTKHPIHDEIWVSHSNIVDVIQYGTSFSNLPIVTGIGNADYGPIRFTKGGSVAYKTIGAKKRVFKIDVSSRSVIDSVTINTPMNTVNAIEVSADSATLYVASTSSKKIFVVNTATMSVTDSVSAVHSPTAMYRHPSKNEIWVVNHTDHKVTVLDASSNGISNIISSPRFPRNLCFAVGPTDITETAKQQKIQLLYPNPTSDVLYLTGHDRAQATIYNTAGQTVLQTSVKQNSIDVSTLAQGLYIIKLTDKGTVYNAQFIKE
ncbi:MAG: T9SS type A sorting domain-containing protein [Chitinophagales bacterium]|nr:T9SS type A sorting domain-containing protein [Chitinophagaceae bacterium]MCB9064998.1 T9SS type A sorting domain-containing protein [Chitinophagales bacterium]